MLSPRISVLLSVFNAEQHVHKCIESILNQTYRDFEFIIINDASTDSTNKVISSYNDSRIKLINNEFNLGLTKSLNKGLFIAKGEFIARIDADDEADLIRFEKQIKFLSQNNMAFCGSRIRAINELNKEVSYFDVPVEPHIVNALVFFKNVFAHPSLMMRKSCLLDIGGYDEEFKYAQDYRLILQLFTRRHLGVNLKDELINYKVNSESISQKYSKDQNYYACRAIQKTINEAFNVSVGIEHISFIRNSLIYREKIPPFLFLICVNYFRTIYKKLQVFYYGQESTLKEIRKIINQVIDVNVHSPYGKYFKRYVYVGSGFNKN